MRVLVFLLILANLLFLAWTRDYFGSPSNPDAFRMQQQLLAERVRIVAIDQPPPPETVATEKPAEAVEKTVADVCMLVTELPTVEATRFVSLLAEKLPAFKVQSTASTGSASYWVHIPPVATRKDAESKAAELKKLGVTDYYIVQEAGPNNRAISLGLFSGKEAAAVHLEMLRGKGVKSARILERSPRPESVSLEIRGPDQQADVLREAVAGALPEYKLAACKAPVTGGQ